MYGTTFRYDTGRRFRYRRGRTFRYGRIGNHTGTRFPYRTGTIFRYGRIIQPNSIGLSLETIGLAPIARNKPTLFQAR